jgi:hypothetical protein
MERNSRKSKKLGKRASKKRVYTKKRFTSLRKTKTARRRSRGSRKMRGGVDPFNADESGIFGEDDTDTNVSGISGMSVDLSEDGETDLDAETTGSYSNVMGFPENASNASNASNISSISNNTSAGPMSVGDLDLSEDEDGDTGNTSLDNDTASFGGNKKRKRSKRSKRSKRRKNHLLK